MGCHSAPGAVDFGAVAPDVGAGFKPAPTPRVCLESGNKAILSSPSSPWEAPGQSQQVVPMNQPQGTASPFPDLSRAPFAVLSGAAPETVANEIVACLQAVQAA